MERTIPLLLVGFWWRYGGWTTIRSPVLILPLSIVMLAVFVESIDFAANR